MEVDTIKQMEIKKKSKKEIFSKNKKTFGN